MWQTVLEMEKKDQDAIGKHHKNGDFYSDSMGFIMI